MVGMKITSSTARMSGVFALMFSLVSLAMCQIAFAQKVEQESSESIEEIIVYGDLSLGALRREVYKAEEKFFDIFNSLNQDFEYDVNCYFEVPSFTHIRHHVCRANFVVEATSVQYVEWRTRGPRYPTVPPELVIAKKKKLLRQKMEALVAEHPELLQALTEYTGKRTTFESERDKR
jgi:hypothetical protein